MAKEVTELRYQNNVLTYGLNSAEIQIVKAARPAAATTVLDTDQFTDLIAIGAFALLINWEQMTNDDQQLLLDYYTEVEVCSEAVLIIGEPKLSKYLKKRFRIYATFEDSLPNLKYILLSAYRKTQKIENFSVTLANAILILSQIRKHPGIMTRELAKQLEITPRSVQRYVETLRIAGEWIEFDRELHGWTLYDGKSVLWGDLNEEYEKDVQ